MKLGSFLHLEKGNLTPLPSDLQSAIAVKTTARELKQPSASVYV